MEDAASALREAGRLIGSADRELVEIVALSLRVSLSAVALAALIGLPPGAALAIKRFPGRSAVLIALNALMGLPPVVVGLAARRRAACGTSPPHR